MNDDELLSSDNEEITPTQIDSTQTEDPLYNLRPPVIRDFFKFNDNYELLLEPIYNLENVDNISTYELPIFHQVWIGPLEDNFLAATLFLTELLKKSDEITARVYYWIDPQLTNSEQLKNHFKTVIAENPDKPTSNIQFEIRFIHDLEKFGYIANGIYKHYIERHAYNYIKEIMCLMCLYEYGGYFFDTTCTLFTDGDKSKLHRLYWKTVPIFAGVGGNAIFDVFFYYSPRKNKIICLLLLMMINTFAIRVHGDHEYGMTLSFSQFLEKPYLIEYVRDPYLNDYLMRLTYIINFCNYCIPHYGHFSNREYFFMLPLRCFLKSLIANENPKTDRFFDNFKILNDKVDHALAWKDLIPEIVELSQTRKVGMRTYTLEKGLYLRKHFNLSTWKSRYT